jgi:hypothetical protein
MRGDLCLECRNALVNIPSLAGRASGERREHFSKAFGFQQTLEQLASH